MSLRPSLLRRRIPEKKSGLLYWAQRAIEECDKASLSFAADPVHDLRVAIRRCRSLADGFLSVDPDPGWKQMKRMGKPLFAALGDLRDVQVMMEWVDKLSSSRRPCAFDSAAGVAGPRDRVEIGGSAGAGELRP